MNQIRICFLYNRYIKPISNYGFINQDFDCNVMFERDMPGVWMSPESFKESGMTLKADKSPWEKQPGTLLIHAVHGTFSR